MTRKNTAQINFEIYRTNGASNGYEHLKIRVFTDAVFMSKAIEFDWVTDSDSKRWYGGSVELEADNYDQLQVLYKLAGRITRNVHFYDNPQAILDKLAKIKAKHVVYDGRESQHIPVEQVKPANISRWIDNYNILPGRSNCKYSALAETEREAQVDILKQAAERQDTDYIQMFIEHGQPVFVPQYDKAPIIVPIDELLAI